MDSLTFDDVPFETEAKQPASTSSDLSFDDVPLEAPPKREAVPISAREQENDPDPFAKEPLSETAKRRGQQFATAAVETFAGAPEGASIANRIRVREVQRSSREVLKDFPKEKAELEAIIQENQAKADQGDWEAKARVTAAKNRLTQVEGQMQMASNMDEQSTEELATPLEKSFGFEAGRAMRQGTEDLVGKPDPRDKSFSGKLASGAGSMVGFVAATVAGSVAAGPAGGLIVGGTMGATSTASQMYKEAIDAGASEEDALKAAKWGYLIGGSEVVPILTGLKYVPAPLKLKVTNVFVKKLAEIAESSTEEAAQEYISQVAQNLAGYEDKPWDEGAAENALIGAILGGGTGAVGAIKGESGTEKVEAPKVETTSEKGASSAEAAALAASNQPVAPPQPVSPAAREPAEAKGGVSVGETSPDVTVAVTAASEGQPAPQMSQAERIKAISRARQTAAQNTATEPAPSLAPVAEGPQAGGAPAAPPTPEVTPAPEAAPAPSAAAQAVQGLDAAREDRAPAQPGAISAPAPTPTESPAKQAADALPPVVETTPAQTTAPSETGGSAPAPEAAPVTPEVTETPEPPKERKYRTVSRRDVLLDAGIAEEQLEAMKPKARDRMASELRAKVQRETGEKLEFMEPAEREKALTKAWADIQALRAKVAPQAPKLPPKAQKAVETSKAKETGPTAEEIAAQKEAERKARVEAYMAEQRQKAQEEAAKPVEPGQKRVLRATTDEALRQDAENAIAQQDQQAQTEAQLKQAEERQQAAQDAAASEPAAPEVTNKVSKAERVRRVANQRTADDIVGVDEHNTNKVEDSFQNNSPKGGLARNAIVARARRMVESASKLMTPDSDGRVLPQRLKMSNDPDLAPNAAQMILFEANRLASKENPSVKDITDFRTNEVLLRAGMINDYLKSRAVEGDIESAPQATQTNKDGEISDVIDRTASEDMTPEQNLEARQEGDDEAQAVANETVADQAPAQESPKVTREVKEGVDYTVGTSKAPKVEVVKRRSVKRDTVRGDTGNIGLKRPVKSHLKVTTAAEAMDRLDPGSIKLFGDKLSQRIIGVVLGRIRDAVPDLPVVIISQAEMEAVTGDPATGGFYNPNKTKYGPDGAIFVSEKYAPNGRVRAHLMAHEGLHAMFAKAIEFDAKLKERITELADKVRAEIGEDEARSHYGLTIDKDTGRVDPHEFISEALSEPEFMEMLRDMELTDQEFREFGIKIDPALKEGSSVWDALKGMVRQFVLKMSDTFFGGKRGYTVLDAVMQTSETLDVIGSHIRGAEGKGANLPGDVAEVRYSKSPRAQSNWNKLLAGGVPRDVAKAINDHIKEELGKSIDPATVPLLIEDYIAEFGKPKATSESNSGGVVPPYKEPPSPGMGPADPITPQPASFKGNDSRWMRKLKRLALKNMTLDFVRQKYGNVLVDKKGSIAKDLIEAVQKRDNIAAEFAEPINKVTAEYTDLMRANRDEAIELAELAMEATRLDVRLGQGGGAMAGGSKALQGNKRIAQLNSRFQNNLSDKGRDIYVRLTKAYREAHNANVEALVYNILSRMENKLSTGDVMQLMKKVTEGKLDAADEALINDPILFNGLKNAQGLKTINGDYFPQMRFGDWVVTTREKLVDPGWTTVPMKVTRNKTDASGKLSKVTTTKDIPVKTEVDGNAVRVIVDPTVRGAQTAAKRKMREYAANHDLTLLGISTMYRDKQTGKLVSKGEQLIDREYDTVYEARFQTEGAHFFENEKDAYRFQKQNGSDVTSEVMTRKQLDERSLPDGSVLGTIVNRINKDARLSAGEKKLFDTVVKNAIIASMDGNSARSRYQARRNVKGASKDLARAAVTYGQAAGNFHATLQTAPDIREAMERLEKFASETSQKQGGGEVSDVAQELRDRMTTIEGAGEPWRIVRTLASIGYIDKLMTPSHSIINALQPMGTTMPVLAGRYGGGRANIALGNAYRKIGALGAIGKGIANAGTAVKGSLRTNIDTRDIIGSIRENLRKQHGVEYDALIDKMLELGAVSPDAGQEVAGAVEADANGAVSKVVSRIDRVSRQLPNAVEAVNRLVTAVATYDLAMKSGKSKQDAVQEAFDTVMNTQGDYRKKNSPRWMQHPSMSWALQFKKYGQMMYQLTVDMGARALNGATPEERSVARKQLAYLYLTQAAMAGVYGLPGLELIKVGSLALSALGFGGWDDEEDELRKKIEESAGKDIGSIINNGLLSTVTQLDFATRVDQSNLALGYLPKNMTKEELVKFAGGLVLGNPGGTGLDLVDAATAFAKGDYEKGLEKSLLIKQVADIIGAARGVADNKLTPYEAAGKVVGFRSLDSAEESRKIGANIREYQKRKSDEKDLRNALIKALDRRDKAAELKAIAAIREYNRQLKRKDRKAKPMQSPESIRKYWRKDQKEIYGEE